MSDLLTESARNVLGKLDLKLDGKRAVSNTSRIRYIALWNALGFAIEGKLLESSPLKEVILEKRESDLKQVAPQAIFNSMQARILLQEVGKYGK